MTNAGLGPLDPSRLVALTAWSRSHSGMTPLRPLTAPVVVDENGYIWTPAPNGRDDVVGSYVHPGFRLGWTPAHEIGGVILIQWGGPESDPAFEDDGLTTFLTRDGLRRLITDLQSIDAQLESSNV